MYSRRHLETEAYATKQRLIKEGKAKEAAEITIPVKVPREPLYFSNSRTDDIPDDSVIIMRYMDFRKFQYLIRESALYMSAPKRFAQDPNEGYCVKSVRNYLDHFCEDAYIKLCKYFVEHPYLRPATIAFSGNKEIDLERMRQIWFKIYKHNIKRFFISCWTERTIEQDNMWRSYIPNPEDLKKAVVIKTTVGKLKQALKPSSGMFTITRVKYVDLDNFTPDDIPNIIQGIYPLNSYMVKLKDVCYEDDREIRVITDNLMSNTTQWYRGGVMTLLGEAGFDYGAEPDSYTFEAPLDLSGFIDEVIVSPTAQADFIDEVKKFLKNNGLQNIPINASRINKRREM